MVTKKRIQLSAQKSQATTRLDVEKHDVIVEQSLDEIQVDDQKHEKVPPKNSPPSLRQQDRIKHIESIIQDDGIIMMERYP